MSFATRQAINWTEQGLVPDSVIRGGIRRLLRARLAHLRADDTEHAAETTARFIADMNSAPIAPLPHKANEQHYELPAEFFAHVLGPAPQVQLLLLAPTARRTSRTPRREALAHDLRARAARRRAAHPRARLRLGLADAVDGGALSAQPRSSPCRTRARSASTSRREARAPRPRQRRGDHLRHERLRDRAALRSRRVGRDVRAHAQLRARCSSASARWLEPGGRFFMHIFVHRVDALCVRRRRRRTTG